MQLNQISVGQTYHYTDLTPQKYPAHVKIEDHSGPVTVTKVGPEYVLAQRKTGHTRLFAELHPSELSEMTQQAAA